jgi:histidinol dehydrogenase
MTLLGLQIKRLKADSLDFDAQLSQALAWDGIADKSIESNVQDIIKSVREKGDSAVIHFTQKFDHLSVNSMAELKLSKDYLRQALKNISPVQKDALELAARRIRLYHQRQSQESWIYQESDGSVFGQKITPMDRVGLYIPGGKASYPSTVLMDAIPAQVAGVPELIAVLPTPKGQCNDLVLAALAITGVDEVYTIGGAQAVAALAYGTETIKAVDKIVGPGNVYVAAAKKAVYGQVGIDMVAGPSEILVICDGKTNPDWIAMDLFSQAEHDEQAQSILLCPNPNYIDAVVDSMNKLLPEMERRDIICASLNSRGFLVDVTSLEQAAEISNRIAPEHLELSVEEPDKVLSLLRHAGAIFMGRHTSEALGDYCAGPSHVLPTSGTARFSSALGVYDFQKRTSLINCSPATAKALAKTTSVLARSEGLTAHARAAELRDPSWPDGL